MGQLNSPITITPEIYLLWDGEPLESLGLAPFLKSAVIGTTTQRRSGGGSSKRARYYIRRKPRVAGAQLSFIIPNQAAAFMVMELFERNARPKITIGFRSPEVNGGKGIFIGTYKIDTLNWKYPADAFVELEISGKTDKYLGLEEYKAPRVFEDKTAVEIITTIAEEHGLIVELVDSIYTAPTTKLSVMKPSGESDFAFLDRVAEITGFAGLTIQPALHEAAANSATLKAAFDGAPLEEVYKDRQFSRRSQAAALGAAEGYLRSVIKLSHAPAFEHWARDYAKRMPKVVLAYGPGIVGENLSSDSLVLLVSELTAQIPHLGGGAGCSARVNKANTIKAINVTILPEAGSRERPVVLDVTSASRRTPIRQANSAQRTASTTKSSKVFRTDNEIPGNKKLYKFYSSSVPNSISNDLTAAHRVAVRTKELGHIGEFEVTLSPGFPFLNSPAEVLLVGTYIHDGVYGVAESTHTYDDSGLVTKLRLLRIGQAKKKKPEGAQEQKEPFKLMILPEAGSNEKPVVLEVGETSKGSTANGKAIPSNPSTRHPPLPPTRNNFLRSERGSEIRQVVEANASVPFVQRIKNFKAYPKLSNPDGSESTHLLGYVEVDGKYLVYPELQYLDGKFIRNSSPNDALERGNFISFDKESEAAAFAQGNWKPLYAE